MESWVKISVVLSLNVAHFQGVELHVNGYSGIELITPRSWRALLQYPSHAQYFALCALQTVELFISWLLGGF